MEKIYKINEYEKINLTLGIQTLDLSLDIMENKVVCGFAKTSSDNGVNNIASPWFATVSKDQRVKIWNTSTASLHQHLTEPQHLGAIYTSVAVFAGAAPSVRIYHLFSYFLLQQL